MDGKCQNGPQFPFWKILDFFSLLEDLPPLDLSLSTGKDPSLGYLFRASFASAPVKADPHHLGLSAMTTDDHDDDDFNFLSISFNFELKFNIVSVPDKTINTIT